MRAPSPPGWVRPLVPVLEVKCGTPRTHTDVRRPRPSGGGRMLSQTKLASTMPDASLRQIEALGEVCKLAPGQPLFDTHADASLDLHVVLRGDLRLHRNHGSR